MVKRTRSKKRKSCEFFLRMILFNEDSEGKVGKREGMNSCGKPERDEKEKKNKPKEVQEGIKVPMGSGGDGRDVATWGDSDGTSLCLCSRMGRTCLLVCHKDTCCPTILPTPRRHASPFIPATLIFVS